MVLVVRKVSNNIFRVQVGITNFAAHVVLPCSGGKLGDQILLIFLWVYSIRTKTELEQKNG